MIVKLAISTKIKIVNPQFIKLNISKTSKL